jgi:translation initiation factor IF-1
MLCGVRFNSSKMLITNATTMHPKNERSLLAVQKIMLENCLDVVCFTNELNEVRSESKYSRNYISLEVGDIVHVLVSPITQKLNISSSTGCFVNVGGDVRGGGDYQYDKEVLVGDILPFGDYLEREFEYRIEERVIKKSLARENNCHEYYKI